MEDELPDEGDIESGAWQLVSLKLHHLCEQQWNDEDETGHNQRVQQQPQRGVLQHMTSLSITRGSRGPEMNLFMYT